MEHEDRGRHGAVKEDHTERIFRMDPSRSSDTDLQELESEELQLKVDFFRKLGYKRAEVKAALRKLGLSTDTNTVLGELLRNRTNISPSISDSDERSSTQKDLLLPPSWDVGPSRTTPPTRKQQSTHSELRPIVIDGSNVAMSHGNKEVFSCRGIQLAVDFFLNRGHNNITVFVPSWRKELPRGDAPLTDQHILLELEKQKIVAFTPSRRVGGKRVVCYDDRFIVKLAYESEGVIVSNDTYRDLQGESPEWKKCIEERLLMYSFVNDKFMPPDDPLGRHGPNLDNFLRKNPLPVEQKKPLCPYDKKCTYGMKCKFYHPERANQSYLSLADELREKAHISTVKEERKARLSVRQPQSDPESGPNGCLHPRDTHLSQDQLPALISENKPLYWEDFRKSPNHMLSSITGGQCQNEYPGLHYIPNHYYTKMPHEYLDSGFGSFDSHYSDMSQSLSNSHKLRPNHQSAIAGVQITESDQSYRSCSPHQQQHHGTIDPKSQPIYDPYHHHMFRPNVLHQHSLPSHFHSTAPPHLHQNYWSDPFQGLPQARTSGSLPPLVHSSHSHSSCCSYKDHPYQVWAQQPPPSPARSELRKKLQAIFNPQEVDRVMKKFPDVTDAEKLAAEIIKLKAQGSMF